MSTAAIYADFRARGGVADLSGRTKLRFTGADRVRYLNGRSPPASSASRPARRCRPCVTTAKGG